MCSLLQWGVGHLPRRAWYQRRRCLLFHRSASLGMKTTSLGCCLLFLCVQKNNYSTKFKESCEIKTVQKDAFCNLTTRRWQIFPILHIVPSRHILNWCLRCTGIKTHVSINTYRESFQEPSSRGFPPRCISSCGPASSDLTVYPALASLHACRRPWAEPARSLLLPQCCPTHREHIKMRLCCRHTCSHLPQENGYIVQQQFKKRKLNSFNSKLLF